MTKVFISWTGKLGREIAIFLKESMFNHENIEPWISEQDISVGRAWFEEVDNALGNSEYGVVCLTPGASKRPWINFEIGYLYGKLNQCVLIRFNEKLSSPLNQIQAMDGYSEKRWVNLLMNITKKDQRQCEAWVNYHFKDLESRLALLDKMPYSYDCQLDKIFSDFHDVIRILKDNEFANENRLFEEIIFKSHIELQEYSKKLTYKYSIPASEYP